MIQSGELVEIAKRVAKEERLAFDTEWSELFEY
jgi:histidine ammonia-lyase